MKLIEATFRPSEIPCSVQKVAFLADYISEVYENGTLVNQVRVAANEDNPLYDMLLFINRGDLKSARRCVELLSI